MQERINALLNRINEEFSLHFNRNKNLPTSLIESQFDMSKYKMQVNFLLHNKFSK